MTRKMDRLADEFVAANRVLPQQMTKAFIGVSAKADGERLRRRWFDGTLGAFGLDPGKHLRRIQPCLH